MESAFGIDHGEFSKGLPRHLKDIQPSIGASPPKQYRGGTKLSRDDYTYGRIRANEHGKHAGVLNRAWKKEADKIKPGALPTNLDKLEGLRQPTTEAATRGKFAREMSRKAIKDNTPKRRQDRGKLP